MKKNNVIPRKFYHIMCKMLTGTSANKPGDVLHVYRNDFGLCAMNTATSKYYYISPSILRDPQMCEFLEVE